MPYNGADDANHFSHQVENFAFASPLQISFQKIHAIVRQQLRINNRSHGDVEIEQNSNGVEILMEFVSDILVFVLNFNLLGKSN